MQILIPISSKSVFFNSDEYYFPKPLIEIAGTPMIELVINTLKSYFPGANFIFVVDNSDCVKFSLDKLLKIAAGQNAKIVKRKSETAGALCSCLLSIDEMKPNDSLMIVNSDMIISENFSKQIDQLIISKADAGVLTFKSVHPKWSYIQEGSHKLVQRVYEKDVMSNKAIAGVYYYARSSDFFNAAKNTLLSDMRFNGLFYISTTLNQMILSGLKVTYETVDSQKVHSFGSPSAIKDYESYIYDINHKIKNNVLKTSIVIPAAGLGSRFSNEGWTNIKPFIDINGLPMIEHVINNLSFEKSDMTVIFRDEYTIKYSDQIDHLRNKNINFYSLKGLTEGTACTVLSVRKSIDNENPLLIANSDQLVDFKIKDFINDSKSRNLDGSILVFKDAEKNPKWSFAKINSDNLVIEVAEKRAISDLATVGIYYFSKGSDFVKAALDMIVANDRVNGEFYTCPVYNYMIKMGAKIGVYEINQDDMHGLGTPEDLRNYIYLKDFSPSIDDPL